MLESERPRRPIGGLRIVRLRTRAGRVEWRPVVVVLALLGGVLLDGSPAAAQAPSEREMERQRILEQLGLERRKTQPPPESATGDRGKKEKDNPDEAGKAPGAPEAPGAAAPEAAGNKAAPPALGFGGRVHSALLSTCGSCHGSGKMAARGYVLDGTVDADFAATRRFVSPGQVEGSALLQLAAGAGHAGGAVLPRTRSEHQLLARWIAEGARRGGEAPAPPLPPALATPSAVPASTPASQAASAPVPASPASAAAAASPPAPSTDAAAVPGSAAIVYAPVVHEQLTQSCAGCHRAGAPGGSSRYLLTGDVAADFASARHFIQLDQPQQSVLLQKASGAPHAGGAPYPPGSDAYLRLLEWIQFGALGPDAAAVTSAAPAPSPAAAPPGLSRAEGTAAATAPAQPAPEGNGSGQHGQGLRLPLQLRLNGRFDLNYERRNFDSHPFSGGEDALQSYHHFLFLTRQVHEDPIGFTMELVDLTFWELNYRLPVPPEVGQLWLKAGKLLVPFGVDPLLHQSYGGSSGFDQRVLPAIWAREGLTARLVREQGALSWSADVYAVAGHQLRQSDAVLSLQGDLSPLDATRVAFGARLRAAYGPAALYYSAYANALGFGRALYLQALDLTLWRPRGVPVLERFAADLGLLRADVSGAGPGADYYHMASYFRVRYFPVDAVYLQYRQGLRTFNNRRGVVFDDTRATAEDGSTHNLGAVARSGPLTFGFYYFFNLEKAGELQDDFLRISGAYEF